MNLSPSELGFIDSVGCHSASKWEQLALLCVAESCHSHAYSTNLRAGLRSVADPLFRRRIRQVVEDENPGKYGIVISVIVALIILTVFEAALSWAVEAFLSWLFSTGGERVRMIDNHWPEVDGHRLAYLQSCQLKWRHRS